MKNKLIFMGAMVCLLSLVLGSCTLSKATLKRTNFDKKPIALIGDSARQYEIFGPVSMNKIWVGVLGFSVKSKGEVLRDHYLWQKGGVTYVELLNKAREEYPGADAVVDINIDYISSSSWLIYAKRDIVVSGIAIKYVKEPEGSFAPANEVEGNFSLKVRK